MADTDRGPAEAIPEKTTEHQIESPVESTHEGQTGEVEVPKGWKYKQIKIGPITLPWFASPQVQLVMVAFVCFLCPGECLSKVQTADICTNAVMQACSTLSTA
jgi:hypothetical protein